VVVESDLKVFLKKVPSADEIWIFSGSEDPSSKGRHQDWDSLLKQEFVQELEKFHQSGRGLAIFASGHPYVAEANALLDHLFQIKLTGALKGDLESIPSLNSSHLLLSGVERLYPGVSSSYPAMENLKPSGFTTIVDMDEHSLVFCKSPSGKEVAPPGRVVVDTNYSKLLVFSDDLRNYLSNIAVWLLSLDIRLRKNFPLTGSLLPEKDIEYIWQYQHGGWYNYDQSASDVVEREYQDYLKNPGKCDVRSVHSGHWNYMVNFLDMTQMNIQHHAHTTRSIRRVPKSQGVS